MKPLGPVRTLGDPPQLIFVVVTSRAHGTRTLGFCSRGLILRFDSELSVSWKLCNIVHGPNEPDWNYNMTDELKKQRKIRGGHRGHVKKLLSQIETAISILNRPYKNDSRSTKSFSGESWTLLRLLTAKF